MPLRLEISVDPASGVGLSRRRSLLKRPSLQTSTDTTSSGSLLCSLASRPRVPTELLERIVDYYVLDSRLPVCYGIPDTANSFATFTNCIEPYITVSKSFRHLLLRSFFRVLVFGKEDAASMLRLLSDLNKEYCSDNGGFLWVKFVQLLLEKSLICSSYQVPPNSKILASLAQLRTMQTNFTNQGLRSQRQSLEQFFGSFSRHGAALKLTSLEFTHMPRIDIHLLALIAREVPALRILRIISTDGLDTACCPNCYEDSLSRIVHSPIPHLYEDVHALSNAFGRALKSLKHLASLSLGVFLSPTHLLDLHIEHGANEMDIRPSTAESVYDCVRCVKYWQSTRQRELLASLILAGYLESLERVEWSSLFTPPCKHEIDCQRCGSDVLRGQVYTDDSGMVSVRNITNAIAAGQDGNDVDNDNEIHDHGPCECETNELSVTFKVQRQSSTTVEVKQEARAMRAK